MNHLQWTLVLTNSGETEKFVWYNEGTFKNGLENEEKLFFGSFLYSKEAHLHKLIMVWKVYLSLSSISLIVKFSHKVHQSNLNFIVSRMLESLAWCFTGVWASDFFWIFFSISASFDILASLSISVVLPSLFQVGDILLFRHFHNNYQIRLYKINVICEKLSCQITGG